jgi:DNA-binding MarR family transcriptional regulator
MHDRLANLLGATALAVHDLAVAGAAGTTGLSRSAAAALVVLDDSPDLPVTELGRRVGLSQPAAARMVDALVADDLVVRRPAAGRAVPVRLTQRGRRMAGAVLQARAAALTPVLAVLDESDRRALDRLLDRLLTRLYADVGSAELMCRLCDRACCTRDAHCPVGRAAR